MISSVFSVFFLYFMLGELPGADVARNLLEAIRAKKDVDQLQTILNNIPANATGHEDFNTDGMSDSFCSGKEGVIKSQLYCRPLNVNVFVCTQPRIADRHNRAIPVHRLHRSVS